MIGWFKRKLSAAETPKIEVPKTLEYAVETFEVGVSTVLVIFDDGREVHTKIYGTVDQYVSTYRDISVFPPTVISSQHVFTNMLHNLKPGEIVKICDDPVNPTVAWTGRVQHMEMHETLKHEIQYTVAKLVDARPADTQTKNA